jgi:hypothetical protein
MYAQQEAERQANKQRSPASTYKKDDKIWLSLRNIITDRPNKKLDWKNAKYIVLEVISTYAVRLNIPPEIYLVFHINLLQPAATDLFPSQLSDDPQPPAIQVEEEDEYQVEEILSERRIRRGKGFQHQYKVK